MSDTNHWATDAPTPPAARDFDRVDYSHDWWHAQLGVSTRGRSWCRHR